MLKVIIEGSKKPMGAVCGLITADYRKYYFHYFLRPMYPLAPIKQWAERYANCHLHAAAGRIIEDSRLWTRHGKAGYINIFDLQKALYTALKNAVRVGGGTVDERQVERSTRLKGTVSEL